MATYEFDFLYLNNGGQIADPIGGFVGPYTITEDVDDGTLVVGEVYNVQDGNGSFIPGLTLVGTAEGGIVGSNGPIQVLLTDTPQTAGNAFPAATSEDFVLCFTAGTMIDTPEGPRPVETLEAGDLVVTRDNGPQPLRWVGSRRMSAAELAMSPALRPVRIKAGALGVGCPSADLLVSPNHRIAVSGWRVAALTGSDSALLAARDLISDRDVGYAHEVAGIEYFHLLFDDHQIVHANGAEAESLNPCLEDLQGVGAGARAEILQLFPDIAERTRKETALPVAGPELSDLFVQLS